MPLLRRKPFVANPDPPSLTGDSEVFICHPTNEVFIDYNEFCERIIQCNSLVWSCSITGRSELTYLEALQSERESQRLLDQFPKELRIPVLYLASVAQKTSFNQLVDDLYVFMKERYFMREQVEFLENEVWKRGWIQAVSQPLADTIASCSGKSRDKHSPSAALYDYDILNADQDVTQKVKAANVRRPYLFFTKDLVRMFLRQSAVTDARGVWVIKGTILQKYGIQNMQFESVFVGKPPVFPSSPKKSPKSPIITSPKDSAKVSQSEKPSTSGLARSPSKKGKPEFKKSRQEKIDKYLQPSKDGMSKKKAIGVLPKKSPKKTETECVLSQKQIAKKLKEKYLEAGRKRNLLKKQKSQVLSEKHKEELKMKAILEKQKRHAAMLQERAKKKEEKLQLEKFIREWKRQRDDLECEDLKALPTPVPVVVRTPNEYFGELIMIMEFVQSFVDVLKVKKSFPCGFSYDHLEQALVDCEVSGPIVHLISMFLKALFALQEKEDDQIDLTEDSSVDVDIDGSMTYDITASEAVRLASAAAGWCKLNHGMDLSSMAVNAMSVTEILRLHLLASGGRAGENSAKWRYQQRGGYRTADDPGLNMRIKQPHILRKLTYMSVCELSFEEKLAIISCLMNQVLTYTSVRNEIEERAEKLRVIKAEVRSLQLAEVRRGKEAHAKRIKEKKEAKLKLLQGEIEPIEPQENEDPEALEAAKTKRLKLDKEFNRRKAEVQKKANKMSTIAMSHQLLALGCDRAHRRYWLFQSVPGLFVEHDPKSAGPCLSKPTPYHPLARGDTLTYVRRLFEEEYNTGSDKENDGSEIDLSRPVTSPNKKKLAEKNESIETESSPPWSGRKSPNVDDDEKLPSEVWGCTASSDCRVHCGEKIQWSFFSKDEDIAALIECLNPRGIRESELRNALMAEREKIRASVAECPLHMFNKDACSENSESPPRKSTRTHAFISDQDDEPNFGFPIGTPVFTIMESVLKTYILDTEEKISSMSLGSLKVDDVSAWRDAIKNNSYKQFCDDLKWGPPIEERDSNSDGESQCSDDEQRNDVRKEEVTSLKRISLSDPSTSAEKAGQCASIPSKKKTSERRLQENYSSMLRVDSAPVTPQPENPTVKNLACALLQLEQGVDRRCMKKPLGDKPKYSQLHRWEVSLMTCTSLSQLFLHVKSLDKSIIWSKSPLTENCCVCQRKGVPEKMLLCSSCQKAHHLYCLRPKRKTLPRDEWYCPTCNAPRLPYKRERSNSPEEEEVQTPARKSPRLRSFSPSAVCELCGLGENLIQCSIADCSLMYHIVCLIPQPKKIMPDTWMCPECKKGVSDVETSKEDEPGSNVPGPSRRSIRGASPSPDDTHMNTILLQRLLRELMTNVDAWPFLRPVRKSEAPDYHTIIKRPMDFSTIKTKLVSHQYTTTTEYFADILLIFENCEMYNQVTANEYIAGERLLLYFKRRCADLGMELASNGRKKTQKRP